MTGSLLQLISIGMQDKHLIGNPEISFFVNVFKRYSNFEKRQYTIKSYNSKPKNSSEFNVSFELPHGPDLIQEMYFRANIKINHYIKNLSSIKLFSSNQLIIELPYTEYTTNQIKKNEHVYFTTDIYTQNGSDYTKIITKNDIYKILDESSSSISDTKTQQIIKIFDNSNNIHYANLLKLFKKNNNTYIPINSDILYLVNSSLDKDLTNIVKESDIKIGRLRIDKHYSQWYDIYNELFEKKHFLRKILNYDLAINNIKDNHSLINIYIPLRFWFNNNPGLAFPMISLPLDEITINLNINTNIGDDFEILNYDLLANFIFLDKEERQKFKNQKLEYLIEQLQFNGSQITPSDDLNFNHPIKALFWTIYDGYNNQNCSLKLNNHFVFNKEPNYFHLIQPYETKLGNGFTMNNSTRLWSHNYSRLDQFHNIGMYSFSLQPSKYQPSGSCNFSLIDTSIIDFKNIIQTSSSLYKIYIFAINYNILRIEEQTASLLFI